MKRLLYFLREKNYVTVRKNDVNKQIKLSCCCMKNTPRFFFIIFHSSSPISMSEILLKPKNYLELWYFSGLGIIVPVASCHFFGK